MLFDVDMLCMSDVQDHGKCESAIVITEDSCGFIQGVTKFSEQGSKEENQLDTSGACIKLGFKG